MESNQNYLYLSPENIEKLKKDDPMPEWKEFMFSFLPEKSLRELVDISEKLTDPYINFLRGLIFEEGVNIDKNIEYAISLYKEGDKKYDPFCSYRLYYYYLHSQQDCELFLIYLLRSFANFDESEDQRFTINPINSLKKLISIYPDLIQLNLKNYFKEVKETEDIYLKNALNFRFLNKSNIIGLTVNDESVFNSLDESLKELENYSKESSICAYFLGSYNYYYLNEVEIALGLLEISFKQKLNQSYYLYGRCLWEQREYESALKVMRLGAEEGCFKCANDYAAQIINKYIFSTVTARSYLEAFNYFMKSAMLGDLWAFDYAFFIFTHSLIKSSDPDIKKFYSEKQGLVYDFCERIHISYKTFNRISTDFTEHGGQYYLLAYCLFKGIGCKVNIKRSLNLLFQGEADKVMSNYRVIYRYLSKVYKTIDDKLNQEKYFRLYIEMVNKLERKFPQHTYFLAKYYLTGMFCEKDVMKAFEFCEEGANFRKDYMLFCPIYYKERSLELKRNILKEYEESIMKAIKEKTNCVICKEKQKLTMFFPCKHKPCCLECGTRIFGENKNCVVCDCPIEFIVNSADL